jgi:hypothetical protein
VILEMIRPAVRWILYSRRRALIALIAIVLAFGLAARLAGGGHPHTSAAAHRHVAAETSGSRRSGPRSASRASSRTSRAAARPSAPPPAKSAPQAAIAAGENFAAAWVSRGADRAALIQAMATPQLAAQLATEDNTLNPATKVTGVPVVTSAEAGLVDLSVPTDAGPAAVSVVQSGGQWLASSVMLEETGS